ncbi:MAG: SMP-30/gluconolactonase/LRE family protein, partial [Flavisolibacter sp.]
MKYIFLLLFVCSSLLSVAQHKLEKLWETDTVVAIPESVLPDFSKNILYVSLIDGGGWDADGKGGIGRLTPDGKKYDGTWITGLNAPKGLGFSGNNLYAADISDVVVVNMPKGKIEQKIAIDSAMGLNDITVDAKGVVYVSDSKTAKIWRIENSRPELFLENIRGVNGLKAIGNELYIGSGKTFMKADMHGNKTVLAELPQGIDGIEPVGNGDFILTAWNGYIFYVPAKGNFEILLDSHNEKMNTADIGYDASKKILYVPTFNAKKVVAYKLTASTAIKPAVFLMDGERLN